MTSDCAHPDFAAEVAVHRLTDDAGRVRNFVAEVKVRCAACGLPFQFLGPPTGFAFKHPTVDVLGTTLSAPIGPGERTFADLPRRIAFEMPPRQS
jgi:hypothetical protein